MTFLAHCRCVIIAIALATGGCQATLAERAGVKAPNLTANEAEQLGQLHDRMVAEILPVDASLSNLLGEPVPILPPDTPEYWQGVAQRMAGIRASLEALDRQRLDDNDQVTRTYLVKLALSIENLQQHWLYSFPVTPYAAGWRHSTFRQSAAATPLENEAHRDRYLEAMRAYGRFVWSQEEKLRLQASKGIRVAGPALPGARTVMANQISASSSLVPEAERLAGMEEDEAQRYVALVSTIVNDDIRPAFAALLAVMDEDYEAAAPERVGLQWQPGGAEQYQRLVALHTNTDLTPDAIHAIGKQILEDARAELEQIKAEVGFDGTNREFADMVDADPRFSATTPEEVEAHFANAMKRIEPVLPDYFSLLPKAPYAVERAPPEIEQGMTFGYYRTPTPTQPVGAYLYNGSDPAGTSYANAAALIYHELLPGHHFHLALQQENEQLPLLRRANSFLPLTAFVEGWAEYAADLAGEMGMYRTPYERYGRLYAKMFLANRLVVDTGLNGLGWTHDDARQFMRENTFASEAQIESELLRYSTDIPGQALAYAMGQRELLRIREEAMKAMGDEFSFPAFHAQILGPGALPMDMLDERIRHWSRSDEQ